jgi:tetratricopeptide (TPR) repeat protein
VSDPEHETLEEVVGSNPTDGLAWRRLGEAYSALDQDELAVDAFTWAVRYAPGDHRAWWGLANCLAAVDRLDEAIEAARRSARLAPADPDAQCLLGFQLVRAGRWHEALEPLEETLRLAPAWHMARGLLGLAQGQVEQHERAVANLLESLRADPDQLRYWPPLGVGLCEEAANALETAVYQWPEHGEAWGRLGQAYRHLGRHREAVRAFEKAVDLEFAPSALWVDLGRSAAELGDVRRLDRACRQLDDALPHEAEDLRERLAAIRAARRSRQRRRPSERTCEGRGVM